MPSEEAEIAGLKHGHIKAVQDQEDRFKGEENELRRKLDQVHAEAVESVGLSRQQPLRHAGLSQCYRAEDALKTFPLGGGKAGARSQVTIDDLDLLPAERTHAFGHRMLGS